MRKQPPAAPSDVSIYVNPLDRLGHLFQSMVNGFCNTLKLKYNIEGRRAPRSGQSTMMRGRSSEQLGEP
jgi:hypothetical protein